MVGLPLPGVGGSVQQPLRAQIDQMGWPDQFGRDPFKPVSLTIPSEEADGHFDGNDEDAEEDDESSRSPDQELNQRGLALEQKGPALELQAVATEGEERIAMINRIMVQEGEKICEYLVVQIRSDAVVLEGPEGLKWLEFLGKWRVSEESEESDESDESDESEES